jgi:hypothetical protein
MLLKLYAIIPSVPSLSLPHICKLFSRRFQFISKLCLRRFQFVFDLLDFLLFFPG